MEDKIEPEEVENAHQEVYHYLPRVLGSVKRYATLPLNSVTGKRVKDLTQKYTNFTKMINTRHPFARLLSAWHDKFAKDSEYLFGSKRYLHEYGKKIAKFPDDNKPNTHHFSFQQFLQYVASEKMENYGKVFNWKGLRIKFSFQIITGNPYHTSAYHVQ